MMNNLVGIGVKELFNITPAQLSLLVPKVRLFSVVEKDGKEIEEKEFIFDDYTNRGIESMLLSRPKRGADAGLISFNWTDRGTDPASAGLFFETSMTLFFQSMEAIFIERENGLHFSELFTTAQSKESKNDNIYDRTDYKIKAVVGWAVPQDRENILIDQRLKSAIEASQTTFLLNLVDHELNLNPDGTVKISLNHVASIERTFRDPTLDLLQIDNKLAQEVNDTLKNLEQSEISQRKKLNELEELIKRKEQELFKSGGQNRFPGKMKENYEKRYKRFSESYNGGKVKETPDPKFLESAWAALKMTYSDAKLMNTDTLNDKNPVDRLIQTKLETDLRQEKIKNLKNSRKRVLTKKRSKAYSNLLTKIIKNNGLYYIDLTVEELNAIGAYQAQEKLIGSTQESDTRAKQLKSVRSRVRNKLLQRGGSFDELRKRIQGEVKANSDKVEARKKQPPPQPLHTYRINYFYFGDLIEAAFETIYEHDRNKTEDFKKMYRMLLGTITMVDPSSGKEVNVPLCDIPISTPHFNLWFRETIIDAGKEKYFLYNFLKDVASKLITSYASATKSATKTLKSRDGICFSLSLVKNTISLL